MYVQIEAAKLVSEVNYREHLFDKAIQTNERKATARRGNIQFLVGIF